MALDWDVLLDGVSVKDEIASFQIIESKGAYARELTLNAADPAFYNQFDFTKFPQLRIEVKTKNGSTWVSQGKYYIEQPVLTTDPDSTLSQGIWGRSETAKAGSPWAVKISKEWSSDTTTQTIMTEMAELCGLTINFEIADYTVYGGTYAVDSVYPIDVISEIAGFTGDYVGCNTAGALVVKSNVFHLSTADYTVTDTDIASISENIEYPEFGNRILISAAGGDASYSVELAILDGTDCLPADGVSTGTVLAFVTDQDGLPANNVSVDWTAAAGITLDKTVSITSDYLINKEIVNADNYYKLTVAYPVSSVVGIWKYADSSHQNNYWDINNSNCVFEGNEIAVADPFTYCNQTLVVSYITAGVATNTVTAGNQSFDVAVTADVGGVQSSVDVKLGNSCACGSSLNVSVASSDAVCFGKYTQILAWATINNKPALGYQVTLACELSCGEAYTRVQTLGYVDIYAEIVAVFNIIEGVSQVKTALPIAEGYDPPRVYYQTGTSDSMYASHSDQTIDLDEQLETGTELLVYYTAAGATTTLWYPGRLSITSDLWAEYSASGCTGTVEISMADGTEAGLSTSVDLSAVDCTVVTDDDLEIPETDDDDPLPEPDPEPEPYYPIEPVGGLDPSSTDDSDYPSVSYPEGGSEGGDGTFPGESTGSISPAEVSLGGEDEGDSGGGDGSNVGQPPVSPEPDPNATSPGGAVDVCGAAILNKISQYSNAIGDDEKAKLRFGVTSSAECTDPPCSCSEMCEAEMYEKGNTYDYPKTIHEQALESGEKNSPAYNEAYEQLKTSHLSECETTCEDRRENLCSGQCEISGPEVLAPGESAEYVCNDGTSALITMPEGACGTQSFTVGCCTFEVRSTSGIWRITDPDPYCLIPSTGGCAAIGNQAATLCSYEIVEGGSKKTGTIAKFCTSLAGGEEQFYIAYCQTYRGNPCLGGNECTPVSCTNEYYRAEIYQFRSYSRNYKWEC